MAKLNFAKKEKDLPIHSTHTWKVLIADDEQDVHTLTKTVLKDFKYDNKPLEFLSSYNTLETLQILKNDPYIALILLDVVMDSDDAGLYIAKVIREELNNDIIQIVLRTGQPGSAPETDVVVHYGINDYKEKTELTSKKLFTTIVTSLRNYKTLKSLKSTKQGLQTIIKASEDSENIFSPSLLIQGILAQIISILKLNHDSILVEHIDGLSIEKNENNYSIIDSTGHYSDIKNFTDVDKDIQKRIIYVLETKGCYFQENSFTGFLEIDKNASNIIYISNYERLSSLDRNLIEMFFKHFNSRLVNLQLTKEILSTQKVLIEALGQIVEKRYVDDPNHIKRVAKMSYLLAKKYGLSEEDANNLETVSPMHDVGKIGIPDDILLKPGKLNIKEFEIIKTHTTIGYGLLNKADKDTLNLAAQVAKEHHERWDGQGYPDGLKGEEISIFGRITAIIDVFDALYNKRCYKEAWEIEPIKEYFEEQVGKQFDPVLSRLFLDNLDEFLKIQETY